MPSSRNMVVSVVIVTLSISFCLAQFRRGGRQWSENSGPIIYTEGGEMVNEDTVRTARETAPHSFDLPNWTNAAAFDRDVFTFVRIIYRARPGRPPWLGWVNDYPDGDLNLSCRLQQLTSMKVDPDGRVLKLGNPELADFPFIFMAQAGGLELNEEEIVRLRAYLLNGGVLMAEDFWGDRDWENFEFQMKTVLPDRGWVELPPEHPLFHCVFELRKQDNKLQVPTIHLWQRGYDPDDPQSFSSSFRGEGSREMHVRGWFDDKQRLMVLAFHNTDMGDAWEREGENPDYFHQFSETRAYPLAVNALFYLMTH